MRESKWLRGGSWLHETILGYWTRFREKEISFLGKCLIDSIHEDSKPLSPKYFRTETSVALHESNVLLWYQLLVGSNSVIKCYAFSALKYWGPTDFVTESGCLCLMSQLKFTTFCGSALSLLVSSLHSFTSSFLFLHFHMIFFPQIIIIHNSKTNKIPLYWHLRGQTPTDNWDSVGRQINPFEVYLILAKASPSFPLVLTYKLSLCPFCCLNWSNVWFGLCWCWIWRWLAPTCWRSAGCLPSNYSFSSTLARTELELSWSRAGASRSSGAVPSHYAVAAPAPTVSNHHGLSLSSLLWIISSQISTHTYFSYLDTMTHDTSSLHIHLLQRHFTPLYQCWYTSNIRISWRDKKIA